MSDTDMLVKVDPDLHELRGLLRDRYARMFSDEDLQPFLTLARHKVPFIAAALIAASLGNITLHDVMMLQAGLAVMQVEKEAKSTYGKRASKNRPAKSKAHSRGH